jgi:hypothetical protein
VFISARILYIRQKPTANQFTMSDVKDIFRDFSKRGYCPSISLEDHTVDPLLRAFGIQNVRNCCLTGVVVYPHTGQPYNDEGAPVYLIDLAGHTHVWYCGRWLGMDALPGLDGHCGAKNGPNCWVCKRFHPKYKSKPGAGARDTIARQNRELTMKDEELAKKDEELSKKDKVLAENDRCANVMHQRLKRIIQERNDEITSQNEQITEITLNRDHLNREK